MKLHITVSAWLVVVIQIAIAAALLANEMKGHGIRLPNPVEKTFKATFPKAEITKVEVEKENGVTVYDFEFKDAGTEKEADITADGTLLEITVVIEAKDVPVAAMGTIQKAATGATIQRVEHVEIGYETRDGKTIKLAKPMMHYEVTMAKGEQKGEIIVNSDGTVVEPASWDATEKNAGNIDQNRPKQVPSNQSTK